MPDATCKHPDGCPEPVRAGGWCARHYQRVYLSPTNDPGPVGLARLPTGAKCQVCGEPNFANGYCQTHRWQYVRKDQVRKVSRVAVGEKQHHRATPEQCIVVVGEERCQNLTKMGNQYGARGMCKLHYERVRRTGVPGALQAKPKRPGGGWVDAKGYVRLVLPDGRRVFEHVHVMEQHLGRLLRPGETVHHKHGLRSENSIGNLELWVTMQPRGQRVADVVEFVISQYPDELETRGWKAAA